jgi:hypothetical protein
MNIEAFLLLQFGNDEFSLLNWKNITGIGAIP